MNLSFLDPFIFRAPVGLSSRLRVMLFRLLGARIGRANRFDRIRVRRLKQIEIGDGNAFFGKDCCLWPADADFDGTRISIGDRNYFNRQVMIDAHGRVEIGNDNGFGPDVYITDSSHRFEEGKSAVELPMQPGRVRIGNNCWIGAKVVILNDVELGDDCLVGAGAVVNKSFPARSVIAGVPARLIRTLDDR